MAAHFRMGRYVFLAFLTLVAGACAPSTTTRPENTVPSTSGSAGAKDGGSDRQVGDGQRGAARESDTGSSSLKDLQAGKPPVTPASSPLQDALFDFDSSALRGDARETLRANANWLKSNPSVRVEIEGHCDDRGTNEYNLALGAKRAQAARDFLATLGIAAERLSTISYGEEIPVCEEQNEGCWKQNRRARFVIIQNRPAS